MRDRRMFLDTSPLADSPSWAFAAAFRGRGGGLGSLAWNEHRCGRAQAVSERGAPRHEGEDVGQLWLGCAVAVVCTVCSVSVEQGVESGQSEAAQEQGVRMQEGRAAAPSDNSPA